MRHAIHALLVASIAFVFGFSVASATEFSSKATNCWHGTSNVIVRGEGDIVASWVLYGSTEAEDATYPLHRTSYKCIGASESVKGAATANYHCESVDGDGDKVFFAGAVANNRHKHTLTGGTGKFEKATGGGTAENLGPYPSPGSGHFVGCNLSDWKIRLAD